MATFTEVADGLEVLARHTEKGMESGVTAVGRLFAQEATTKYLPPLDMEALERLGWRYDDLVGCWALPVDVATNLLQGDATKPQPCDSL